MDLIYKNTWAELILRNYTGTSSAVLNFTHSRDSTTMKGIKMVVLLVSSSTAQGYHVQRGYGRDGNNVTQRFGKNFGIDTNTYG